MANATNHYAFYPDEPNVPPYLAYGFRPIFLTLAPYIVVSTLLWALAWAGVVNPFGGYMLEWHIYEYLYGVGLAGIIAFVLTGLPELFPGVVPLIGKKLKWWVLLWIAGRVSFWLIAWIPVWLIGLINMAMLIVVIAWAFKPVVLDPLQRHASIGYTLVALLVIEGWFYASLMGLVSSSPMEILKVALGGMMVLVVLALRRVNMEAINETIEDAGIEDEFLAKPYRYNFAIFLLIAFTCMEFFYPLLSVTGWLGLAVAAALLGILSDYELPYSSILFMPYTMMLASVPVLMALGYGGMGIAIVYADGENINHWRHFITTGAFGVIFYGVMLIVSLVHTGRKLTMDSMMAGGLVLIFIATFMRVSIGWSIEYSGVFYASSAILWAGGFGLYFLRFYRYLLTPRADGIAG